MNALRAHLQRESLKNPCVPYAGIVQDSLIYTAVFTQQPEFAGQLPFVVPIMIQNWIFASRPNAA